MNIQRTRGHRNELRHAVHDLILQARRRVDECPECEGSGFVSRDPASGGPVRTHCNCFDLREAVARVERLREEL